MIVEVRTYRTKTGCRDAFLALFETRTRPLQEALGMGIIGPFVHLEQADMFTWLRTFPSLPERDRMKALLYDGDEWKNELEAIAMPMLDQFDVVLAKAQPRPSADPTGRAPVRLSTELKVEDVMYSMGIRERIDDGCSRHQD